MVKVMNDNSSNDFIREANKMLRKSRFTNEISITEYFNLKELFSTLVGYDLLVGVPSDNTARNSNDNITNSELVYIHTYGVDKKSVRKRILQLQRQGYNFKSARRTAQRLYEGKYGSPAYRIPPRPIIEPAIEANSEKIQEKIDKAVDNFLNFDFVQGEKNLKKAGMFAQNKVRAWFTDEKNGWPPNSPSTIAAKSHGNSIKDKPLIDTGEMRKSITYVVVTPDTPFRQKIIKLNENEEKRKERQRVNKDIDSALNNLKSMFKF